MSAIKPGGILIVPHLLWHGASGFFSPLTRRQVYWRYWEKPMVVIINELIMVYCGWRGTFYSNVVYMWSKHEHLDWSFTWLNSCNGPRLKSSLKVSYKDNRQYFFFRIINYRKWSFIRQKLAHKKLALIWHNWTTKYMYNHKPCYERNISVVLVGYGN